MKLLYPWVIDDKFRPLHDMPFLAELSNNGHELRITAYNIKHANDIRTINNIAGIPVTVSAPLARIQGTIWAPELDHMDTDELL